MLAFNLVCKFAVVCLDGCILNTGVNHGSGQVFMPKQMLDLDNIHACVEQTGSAGMAQTMRMKMLNSNSRAETGNMIAQVGGRKRFTIFLKPDEIARLPLAVLRR